MTSKLLSSSCSSCISTDENARPRSNSTLVGASAAVDGCDQVAVMNRGKSGGGAREPDGSQVSRPSTSSSAVGVLASSLSLRAELERLELEFPLEFIVSKYGGGWVAQYPPPDQAAATRASGVSTTAVSEPGSNLFDENCTPAAVSRGCGRHAEAAGPPTFEPPPSALIETRGPSRAGQGPLSDEGGAAGRRGRRGSGAPVEEGGGASAELYGPPSKLLQLFGPASSYCNSATWRQREQQLAHIIPVTDVRHMTRNHWLETLALERRYLPCDWSPAVESQVLGEQQPNVNREHRHRIVNWMSEACSLFSWTSQTFFTAVHAWDCYMTMVSHEIATADLAKLSAACLYFGAQLVESAADENVKTLDEFLEMCPEVGSSFAVRDTQAHLVDTLQGICLVRRTPVEFLLLYLAQLQNAPPPCLDLYKNLLRQGLLSLLWNLVVGVSLVIFTNGLVLDGLPPSRWVAGAFLRILEFSCPALKHDEPCREILYRRVFHMPPNALEAYQSTILDPIIRATWRLVTENIISLGAAPGSDNNARKGGSGTSGSAHLPYKLIRHQRPAHFYEWPVTQPSNRIVRDVSSRLRAMMFDTVTPPNPAGSRLDDSAAVSSVAPGVGKRLPVTSGDSKCRRLTSSQIAGAASGAAAPSSARTIVTGEARRRDPSGEALHSLSQSAATSSTAIGPPTSSAALSRDPLGEPLAPGAAKRSSDAVARGSSAAAVQHVAAGSVTSAAPTDAVAARPPEGVGLRRRQCARASQPLLVQHEPGAAAANTGAPQAPAVGEPGNAAGAADSSHYPPPPTMACNGGVGDPPPYNATRRNISHARIAPQRQLPVVPGNFPSRAVSSNPCGRATPDYPSCNP